MKKLIPGSNNIPSLLRKWLDHFGFDLRQLNSAESAAGVVNCSEGNLGQDNGIYRMENGGLVQIRIRNIPEKLNAAPATF